MELNLTKDGNILFIHESKGIKDRPSISEKSAGIARSKRRFSSINKSP